MHSYYFLAGKLIKPETTRVR